MSLDRLREIAEAATVPTHGAWLSHAGIVYQEACRGASHDAHMPPCRIADVFFKGLPQRNGSEAFALARHIAAFDPSTVLALLDVAEAARDTVEAHDDADDEQDWTAPAVDLLLRDALARLREVSP